MTTGYFAQGWGRIWRDGAKVVSEEGCEVNIVGHCNMSCRACGHLSPVAPRSILAPDELGRDLSRLAGSFHAGYVKVVGGEPLLHPALPAILEAIRDSGVADRIRICTNGTRLGAITAAVCALIDELEVMAYPGRHPDADDLDRVGQLARRANVDLRVFSKDHFRESYSESPTDGDPEVTQRVFAACQMAHRWRSHTVDGGYFFKCPMSLFIPRHSGSAHGDREDGLLIRHDASFADDLWAYLQSSQPLRSCGRCCGTAGTRFPHREVARREWRLPQRTPRDDLVDWGHLLELEHDPGADDGTVSGQWRPVD